MNLLQFEFVYLVRRLISFIAVFVALVGITLAQGEASSNIYLVDFDPARYDGPPGLRVEMSIGDQPRNVTLGTKDVICVQLNRAGDGADVVSARVRALQPEPQPTVEVRVIAPDISPGTFRSTPWGLLLRAVPASSANGGPGKAFDAKDAAVCAL